MSDVFSTEKRSDIMRKVKSAQNRSTELRLIAYFKENGITGWRRNYPVKGKPDFVFLRQKVAVFTDGCFWHGHDCRNTRPDQNQAFWQEKRARNQRRDEAVNQRLTLRGWTVVRIWECEIKKREFETKLYQALAKIAQEE